MSDTSNEQYYRYRKIAIRIRDIDEGRRLSFVLQMSEVSANNNSFKKKHYEKVT